MLRFFFFYRIRLFNIRFSLSVNKLFNVCAKHKLTFKNKPILRDICWVEKCDN